MGSGVEADDSEHGGKSTQAAAVSYSLGILTSNVAWAEIGDDA